MNSKEELYWKRVDALRAYLKKVDKKLPMMYNMFRLKLPYVQVRGVILLGMSKLENCFY